MSETVTIQKTHTEGNDDMFKHELLIGAGLTLLGGVIGFLYSMMKSSNSKKVGKDGKINSLQEDLKAGFEGALVGIIISLIVILIYRAFFHAQAAHLQQKTRRQAYSHAMQLASARQAKELGTIGQQVSPEGLQRLGEFGIRPRPVSAGRTMSAQSTY